MIHLVDLSKSLLSFSMGLNTTPATRLFVQNNSIIKKVLKFVRCNQNGNERVKQG